MPGPNKPDCAILAISEDVYYGKKRIGCYFAHCFLVPPKFARKIVVELLVIMIEMYDDEMAKDIIELIHQRYREAIEQN